MKLKHEYVEVKLPDVMQYFAKAFSGFDKTLPYEYFIDVIKQKVVFKLTVEDKD